MNLQYPSSPLSIYKGKIKATIWDKSSNILLKVIKHLRWSLSQLDDRFYHWRMISYHSRYKMNTWVDS